MQGAENSYRDVKSCRCVVNIGVSTSSAWTRSKGIVALSFMPHKSETVIVQVDPACELFWFLVLGYRWQYEEIGGFGSDHMYTGNYAKQYTLEAF